MAGDAGGNGVVGGVLCLQLQDHPDGPLLYLGWLPLRYLVGSWFHDSVFLSK